VLCSPWRSGGFYYYFDHCGSFFTWRFEQSRRAYEFCAEIKSLQFPRVFGAGIDEMTVKFFHFALTQNLSM